MPNRATTEKIWQPRERTDPLLPRDKKYVSQVVQDFMREEGLDPSSPQSWIKATRMLADRSGLDRIAKTASSPKGSSDLAGVFCEFVYRPLGQDRDFAAPAFTKEASLEKALLHVWLKAAFDKIAMSRDLGEAATALASNGKALDGIRVLAIIATPFHEALVKCLDDASFSDFVEAMGTIYESRECFLSLHEESGAAIDLPRMREMLLKDIPEDPEQRLQAATALVKLDKGWRRHSFVKQVRRSSVDSAKTDKEKERIKRRLREGAAAQKGRPWGRAKFAGVCAYVLLRPQFDSDNAFYRWWASYLAEYDPMLAPGSRSEEPATKRPAAVAERWMEALDTLRSLGLLDDLIAASPIRLPR